MCNHLSAAAAASRQRQPSQSERRPQTTTFLPPRPCFLMQFISQNRTMEEDLRSMMCADTLALAKSTLINLTAFHSKAKQLFAPTDCDSKLSRIAQQLPDTQVCGQDPCVCGFIFSLLPKVKGLWVSYNCCVCRWGVGGLVFRALGLALHRSTTPLFRRATQRYIRVLHYCWERKWMSSTAVYIHL